MEKLVLCKKPGEVYVDKNGSHYIEDKPNKGEACQICKGAFLSSDSCFISATDKMDHRRVLRCPGCVVIFSIPELIQYYSKAKVEIGRLHKLMESAYTDLGRELDAWHTK